MPSNDTLQSLVETFNTEYAKFISGNKSAGTRARKALSEIAKACKVIRTEIQDSKKTT